MFAEQKTAKKNFSQAKKRILDFVPIKMTFDGRWRLNHILTSIFNVRRALFTWPLFPPDLCFPRHNRKIPANFRRIFALDLVCIEKIHWRIICIFASLIRVALFPKVMTFRRKNVLSFLRLTAEMVFVIQEAFWWARQICTQFFYLQSSVWRQIFMHVFSYKHPLNLWLIIPHDAARSLSRRWPETDLRASFLHCFHLHCSVCAVAATESNRRMTADYLPPPVATGTTCFLMRSDASWLANRRAGRKHLSG